MAARTFLEFVQLHERTWGTTSYLNKPSLEKMMHTRIVVFWLPTNQADKSIKNNPRYKATVHNDLREVEAHLLKMLLRSHIDPPKEQIAKIFENGEPMRIKSINVVFEPEGKS